MIAGCIFGLLSCLEQSPGKRDGPVGRQPSICREATSKAQTLPVCATSRVCATTVFQVATQERRAKSSPGDSMDHYVYGIASKGDPVPVCSAGYNAHCTAAHSPLQHLYPQQQIDEDGLQA